MDFICTLYEKHYDYGVGALYNSLVKVNFKGKIIIGYKDNLPFWIPQLTMISLNVYRLNIYIELVFIQLDHIKIHFAYYKPQFILDCIEQNSELETICYFDPDITLKAERKYFNNWINTGIALATDNCYPFLHVNHPWRKEWELLFSNSKIISKPECYVNSGFIGLKKSEEKIIKLWLEASKAHIKMGGNQVSFERNPEKGVKTDQDLLNAALMYYPYHKLSIIGREAMGFEPPNYIMGHAISGTKPWKKNFTIDALIKSEKPSFSEKIFFDNTNYPIKLYRGLILKIKKFDILIANLIIKIL